LGTSADENEWTTRDCFFHNSMCHFHQLLIGWRSFRCGERRQPILRAQRHRFRQTLYEGRHSFFAGRDFRCCNAEPRGYCVDNCIVEQ
jgi:hypothetical protein